MSGKEIVIATSSDSVIQSEAKDLFDNYAYSSKGSFASLWMTGSFAASLLLMKVHL